MIEFVRSIRIPVSTVLMPASVRPVQSDGSDELSKNLPVTVTFGLSIPPLPLPAGQVYEWIFDIGETEVAAVQFAVRSQDVMVSDEPHSGEPE
ncbi:hypothetical protein [Nonomuraea sp. NPDC050786]|uniref:hypothetical protein n=1 Tax=Nonomuraea sp. NPDC050786 TaxID=3154840 RepID=UPI00340C94F5